MTKFSDLALDPRVLQAVSEAGYESPTPIQAEAIPEALKGRDVLGIAQTGTGKTASFTLPMITLLGQGRARARMPRSLVLCPTRELAAQVAENFDIYAKHTKLTKALLIGGVAFGEQDKLIDRGVDVLIATPGRLLDHFERGKLLLTGVQIMVVDEADRMLDMGFIPDIERIFQLTPFTRQTMFYSATMAPEIERITNTFLNAPARVEVARQATTNTNIDQKLVFFTPSRKDRTFTEKRAVLRELIRAEGEACTNGIIFCNRKMDVDVVAKSLKSHGFNAAPIHGDLAQSERMKTLDAFRDGSLHILVASDVAARGLDIPAVSHVFNFDVPSHPEDYVHRIGRTGRAGRHGKAFTISTPHDARQLAGVEALIKTEIPRAELPEGTDLAGAGSARPPRERSESKPRGERGAERAGRGRDRSRGGERERAAREDQTPVLAEAGNEQPQAPAEPQSEPRQSEPRQNEPRREKAEPRRDAGRSTGRDSQRQPREAQTSREPAAARENGHSNGRDSQPRDNAQRDHSHREHHRRDRRDDGPQVVGMGDHVPEFLLRSFRIDFPQIADEPADDPRENEVQVLTDAGSQDN
ncbi:DEAD/DEAH box helicase [Pseudogemmobacter faecipullorum]|uniref:DEAD/DEAH box helicase n=1 Tax=Pseudogemmobacter faecipullorum TaxID=2755041 RepID=A0ABS8CMK3_9RHOB|nr:DEAD/DEAH box helicase [Pseudogemmobacter faecipullorum]MCB5410604.1 DEAD/DEAH box helicase [Pseudogemmobacter faecipullorum]